MMAVAVLEVGSDETDNIGLVGVREKGNALLRFEDLKTVDMVSFPSIPSELRGFSTLSLIHYEVIPIQGELYKPFDTVGPSIQ